MRAALRAAPPAPAPGAPRRPRCGGRLRPSAPLAQRRAPTCSGLTGRSGALLRPEHPVPAHAAPPGPSALHSATPASVGDGQGGRVRGAADTFPYSHLNYSDTGVSHRGLGHFLGFSLPPFLRFCEMGRSSAAGSCGRILIPFPTPPTRAPPAPTSGRASLIDHPLPLVLSLFHTHTHTHSRLQIGASLVDDPLPLVYTHTHTHTAFRHRFPPTHPHPHTPFRHRSRLPAGDDQNQEAHRRAGREHPALCC